MASAAGGAECLVHQDVAAGVETGCGQCCRWSRVGETCSRGKSLHMYIVVLSIFCVVFPFEFFCFVFSSPFGGERRGEHDGKGGEVYMAVTPLGGGRGGKGELHDEEGVEVYMAVFDRLGVSDHQKKPCQDSQVVSFLSFLSVIFFSITDSFC